VWKSDGQLLHNFARNGNKAVLSMKIAGEMKTELSDTSLRQGRAMRD